MSGRVVLPLVVALVASVLLVSQAEARYGWDAHRISAQVAEYYLSDKAWANVLRLTNNQTLADICTWADDVRCKWLSLFGLFFFFHSYSLVDTTHPWSYSLHFVNPFHDPLAGECGYVDARDCVDDFCVTSAVSNFTTQLKENRSSEALLSDAVKFLTHFIGDMHQPLHGLQLFLFLFRLFALS